ncbi:MAG TPA: hypothetical protein VLZ83_04265 [Edaphocola sp.]|nr:hypothetical protein [Edaphocola sp.]
MKKIIYLFIALLITSSAQAQAPQKMSYQSIIRNAAGDLISATNVGMRISILKGSAAGTSVYKETQNITTNANGLASLDIGAGSVVSGTMANINWGNNSYYIKTEIDPTGGTNYSITGTSQLLSVPYALYSGSTTVTAILPPGCQKLVTATTTFTKIADLGTFTKKDAHTFIELNMQSNFSMTSLGTSTGVIFELRIDDDKTTLGRASLRLSEATTQFPGTITGIFPDISTGVHTVSIWARSSFGTASNVGYDPGCWNNFYSNNLYIKEYR